MSKLITFILPTIGRLSIINTIQSLKRLKTDLWECIIIFDGVKNTILPTLKQDRRFRIFEIDKLGGAPNHSGLVRNYAFPFVSTPWIGFIDDDDTLSPYYIDNLLEEIKIQSDQLDTILFRMIYRNKMILPNKDDMDIKEGHVGISFCFKRELLHEYPELQFENSSIEDFLFLQNIKNHDLKIVLSPYICYYVKSNYFPLPDIYKDLPRYVIVSKDKMKEKLKELKILHSQHQISTQKQNVPSHEMNSFQQSVYEKLLKPSRDLMNNYENENENEEYQFEDEFSKTPILYTSYLKYHEDEDNESFLEDTEKEEFINKPLEESIFQNEKKIENYEKEIQELLRNQKNSNYPLSSKSKKRIYLETQGGFGNLLFQVFTALSLCIQYNRELYILHNEHSTLQRPDIDKYSIFNFLNIIHKHEIPGYYITFKEPNMLDNQSIHSFIKSNIQDDIYLKGYFQCVYYFQDKVPQIEPYLNFTHYHISQKILKIWKETENIQKKCIGIHIRGMDYKSLKHIYQSLSDEYYQRMLDTINKEEYHLIIFTDDIPYVKENFSFYKKYEYHFARTILKKCGQYKIKNLDEMELYILSQMDILLCANSTFSLWSTYFSKKDSIFYIPSQWYQKDGPNIPYSYFQLKNKNYRIISI